MITTSYIFINLIGENMIYIILASIIFSIISVLKEKDIYYKLVPLLTIQTKVSILIILYSYIKEQPMLIDIGIFYLLLSIGGTFVISSFISRSDL